MDLIALCIAIASLAASLVALGFALGARADASHVKAQLEHGITRDDVDKLHHRVNVLVEKMGGLQASFTAQANQIARMDSYLRKGD